MFVRYVSHGIRTPLNTAFLGLKLLFDDLRLTEDMQSERLRTVDEIKRSCSSTITFLEDLLAYDSIEGGLEEPNMQNYPAWSFLRDVVKPFLAPVGTFHYPDLPPDV